MAEAITTQGLLHALTARLRQYAPGSDIGLALGVVLLLSVLPCRCRPCCSISDWRSPSPPRSWC